MESGTPLLVVTIHIHLGILGGQGHLYSLDLLVNLGDLVILEFLSVLDLLGTLAGLGHPKEDAMRTEV